MSAIDQSRTVWCDEFNQPVGSAPDAAFWSHDLGATGWGNAELECYTDRRENCEVVADENASHGRALVIRARRAPDGSHTSARIKTQGKYGALHGRIEARLKLPQGQGIWPAFWMMGANIDRSPWPDCGEIDIMEVLGHDQQTLHSTIHGPGYSGKHGISKSTRLPAGQRFCDAYHVFAVDWSPGRVAFSCDGAVYHTRSPADLPAGTRWVFDDGPFFLILNVAIGGHWPGYPDDSTVFPQEMRIDYVRVETSSA
ncbi:MAG TPA: glycoside hydrolase family 16 protein [Lacunisphaera sp.]|jgi:beta-glucanase (GH16 family)|nr:glycoside hydrolase family 16 protein [Lacunisphaera sp.]